jgi:hypothetical protein
MKAHQACKSVLEMRGRKRSCITLVITAFRGPAKFDYRAGACRAFCEFKSALGFGGSPGMVLHQPSSGGQMGTGAGLLTALGFGGSPGMVLHQPSSGGQMGTGAGLLKVVA